MPFLVTKKPAFSKFAVLELSKENKLNAPISRQIVSGFTIQIFLIHGITSLAIGRQYYILGNRSTFLNVNAGPRTKALQGIFNLGTNFLPLFHIFLGHFLSELVWVDRGRCNPQESRVVHFSPKLRHSDKSNNRVEKFHSSLV